MKTIRIYILLCASIAIFAGCAGVEETGRTESAAFGERAWNIINLEMVNSSNDDFAPSVLREGSALVFTSNRPSQPDIELIDKKSRFGEALYIASGTPPRWGNPALLFPATPARYNQGSFAETSDGTVCFYGASYRTGGVGGTDIYRIVKAVGQWGTPEVMKDLSSKWWDSHPALSPDGSTLVFASDREEGDPTSETEGARSSDLWMAKKISEGVWSQPIRLPAPINSDESEISPFFSTDGYLYFATNRFSDAGFDIVRVRSFKDERAVIERLGEPVNSADDDVFPFVTADRSTIYFASNRPGGKGGLDLYAAGFPYRIKLAGEIVRVEEYGVKTPAQGVPVIIEDLKNNKSATVYTNVNGVYETELDPDTRYRLMSGSTECYGTAGPEELATGVPMSMDTTITKNFSLARTVFPTFQLGRYNIPFFVTGYYYPNTNANLDRLMNRIDSGELKVEPGGNTPYIDIGDEDYRSFATKIELIFDTVYATIERDILPLFNKCALSNELLKIEVRGFVDPRGLSYGIYVDKTVTTEKMRIEKGSVMARQEGNDKLANLRAYYTMEMIDAEMTKRSESYRKLKADGRILLTGYGVGIDTETGGERLQDPAKRRIDIKLSIVAPKK